MPSRAKSLSGEEGWPLRDGPSHLRRSHQLPSRRARAADSARPALAGCRLRVLRKSRRRRRKGLESQARRSGIQRTIAHSLRPACWCRAEEPAFHAVSTERQAFGPRDLRGRHDRTRPDPGRLYGRRASRGLHQGSPASIRSQLRSGRAQAGARCRACHSLTQQDARPWGHALGDFAFSRHWGPRCLRQS